MSDSEYESDYGEQKPPDEGVQKQDRPKKQKKAASEKKLEQLRKARLAKQKKERNVEINPKHRHHPSTSHQWRRRNPKRKSYT